MTPDELRDARAALGKRWGLDRPLNMTEMGRALRLGGRDPGESIRDYERGKTRISGPMSVAVDMMLAGALPPDGLAVVRTTRSAIAEDAADYDSFGDWLLAQAKRDDPIGDLARDAKSDKGFAWRGASVQSASEYLQRVASYPAIQAFRRAAFEYTGDQVAFGD